MSLLDDILSRLNGLPEEAVRELEAERAKAKPVWVPNPGAQTDAYFSKADLLLYGGAGGGGKALALDTPLPTPTGWTTMGEVQVGDALFDETGAVCRVVGATSIMNDRPCYRVTFSDGAEIVADAEHQWLTMTANDRAQALRADPEWQARRRANRPSRAKATSQKPWVSASISRINSERVHVCNPPTTGAIRTTEHIAQTIAHRQGYNHSVAVPAPIACNHADLLIDPYILGVWLGDGSSYKAEITTADDEIVNAMATGGYTILKRGGRYAYGVNGGLKVALGQLGLIANKHIPAAYLRGSVDQRLALLQGLMDTDGYCDARGQCEFTITKRRLADDTAELLTSLGIKVRIAEGVAKLKGRTIGPKYRLKFLTEMPAFRLPRKLIRQKRAGFKGNHDRRYIVAVTAVPSIPVRCVEVDSQSHLYLAGRQMIPTHNSDLGLGLAFTAQQRSLILRRRYANLSGLTERAIKINGSRNGFNGSPPPLLRTADGRYIQFGANQHLGDEQDWQGIPFDFKYFDEGTQFLEAQIRFHLGWLRDAENPNQRTRAIIGTNPPIDADGDFIIGMFRPWLDTTHANPAKPGELRWYVTAPDGSDLEVTDTDLSHDAHGRRIHKSMMGATGKPLMASSRSFIPAKLADNPYLVNTTYGAQLDSLPEPLRSAVRDGNFMALRSDAEFQVIPTDWVVQAQARWRPNGHEGVAMTAMSLDPAGGGKDSEVLIWRHGNWFSEPIKAQGEKTSGSQSAAAAIFLNRKDGAPVVVDAGGGYSGAVTQRLADNSIPYIRFNGANSSIGRTLDSKLPFKNKRAEAWWRFREALDPSQAGGSKVALPPSPTLRADLTAPCIVARALEQGGEIQIESKEDLRKRLGRSPDEGDACVMCWTEGIVAVKRANFAQADRPKYANVGRSHIIRRR